MEYQKTRQTGAAMNMIVAMDVQNILVAILRAGTINGNVSMTP